MTYPFTPAQSAEIDDRIVEMIAAAIGEGPAARSARAIANTRYLDRQAEKNGDDDILPVDIQPIAAAPRDRFILTHCPDAPRCGTWPTAPWILAKWQSDTEAWHDEEGIRVKATGWLPLTNQSLRQLSPEDSGRSERALLSEGRASSLLTAEQENHIRELVRIEVQAALKHHAPAATSSKTLVARRQIIDAAQGLMTTLDAIAAGEDLAQRSPRHPLPHADGHRHPGYVPLAEPDQSYPEGR